ncbi:uncharacterized protein LOC132755094 [Ruditapes philippinarum]|uniref:uncharacterized protein LOC132755094 n=1 Tax=Ruditapes philippinarum TaxID=129788 RepID=UPI00295A751D|nr:uncharacterized protein LOC132755094 [Ruditapes philippinarum]
MDQKEFRERMGTNHHFHPELNPQVPKTHWWNKQKPGQPLQINRPRSSTLEDTTSSPVGSPVSNSPHMPASPVGSPATVAKGAHVPHINFDFNKQRTRSFKADDHKDSILT